MHLVNFIIRIYHDARPPERQTQEKCFLCTRNSGDVLVASQILSRYSQIHLKRNVFLPPSTTEKLARWSGGEEERFDSATQ